MAIKRVEGEIKQNRNAESSQVLVGLHNDYKVIYQAITHGCVAQCAVGTRRMSSVRCLPLFSLPLFPQSLTSPNFTSPGDSSYPSSALPRFPSPLPPPSFSPTSRSQASSNPSHLEPLVAIAIWLSNLHAQKFPRILLPSLSCPGFPKIHKHYVITHPLRAVMQNEHDTLLVFSPLTAICHVITTKRAIFLHGKRINLRRR